MRRLDDKGNVAVEFALVAPVFILLVAGLVDYGMAARNRAILDAAARGGMQQLIDDWTDTSGAESTADTLAAAVGDSGTPVITVDVSCRCGDGLAVDCSTGSCTTGSVRRYGSVAITMDHITMIPWPGIDETVALSALSSARLR